MKHKFLLSVMFLILIVGLFVPTSYSQNPTFTCTLRNDSLKSPSVVQFDVYILRTDTIPLQLYTYQVGLTYHVSALNGGTITAAWSNIDSSIVAAGNTPATPGTALAGVIKCAVHAPSGGPTHGPFVSNVAPGMKFGTLTITCTQPISFNNLGIAWCFISTQYPTKVQATINGLVVDITASGSFNNTLLGVNDNNKSVLPKEYFLLQNYPNPFNPSTVISYSLPSASDVKLTIYNSLGQRIQVLENGFKSAGTYSVTFNASELPSGIYFYKIEAGKFIQVKKMMLIK
jgi:hypothetical protein